MAGAHAAIHAAIANAIKATGVVVRLEPNEWLSVLKRNENAVVVVAEGGMFKKSFRYLTSYRGLAFFTKSDQALVLPGRAEVITAKSISLPDM
jgi:hypothetical protein